MELNPLVLVNVPSSYSVDWILVEELRDYVSASCAEASWEGEAVELGVFLLLRERGFTCQHLVHQNSNTPAIYFIGIILPFHNLRRYIIHSPTQSLPRPGSMYRPPEVCQFQSLPKADNILRFDIPMHDASLVQVRHC